MFCENEILYRLVVAVDIEKFSHLPVRDQHVILTRLREVLGRAAENAQLDRTTWHRQPRGDGELAVLPPDTDIARVVADFTHRIAEELNRGGQPRMRLRMAMHHGTVTGGAFGPIGDAPIAACRLLNAKATRLALAEQAAGNVVLVVSRRLYLDVVAERFHGLLPERFQPMSESTKSRTYHGYLCVGSPRTRGGFAAPPERRHSDVDFRVR